MAIMAKALRHGSATVTASPGDALPSHGDGVTVLLVEHRSADAHLIAQALESDPDETFHVVVQRSPAAAIEALAGMQPDVILLDTDLPNGQGMDALEEMRAAVPALPLVALAGGDDGDAGVRAMGAGAQDYVIKGELDQGALGRVLRQAMARQRLKLDLSSRLREAENTHIRLRNIVDLNLDGILVVDRSGRILFSNRAAEQLLGAQGAELLREHIGRPGADVAGIAVTLHDAGRPRTVHMRMYPTGWDEQEAFMVLLREPLTTERPGQGPRVTQPDRDPVTGLANRQAFGRQCRDVLRTARHRGTTAAMVCLNLERFRRVNEAMGHAAGDAVLRRVAERLRRELRAGDLLGCFGSDEFLVLLTSLRRSQDAAAVARKLLEVVGLPLEHDGKEIRIHARAGISLFPRDGGDAPELIGHAQIAAERARRQQDRRIAHYTSDLAWQSARQFQLEQGLHKALANDQFTLLYQPIIDLPSDRPVAAEALLRWLPEPGTVVAASEFVPILEEIGLIDEVGTWVLRTACAEARAWLDQGHPLPVSVNLSPLQFASENLLETVRAALADSGLPPEHLWVEVTESALMQPIEESIDTLGRLRELGVSICIDDFGTGFSSLSYLKRFPIDTLKIDRSFVRDLVTGAKDAAITRNIILLAHALDLTVVAEGVEAAGQLDRLREFGCDLYQGHMASPPLACRELSALLAGNRR